MKLQEFEVLLAGEHRRTIAACEALTSAFTELNTLRRKPCVNDVALGAEVLAVSRQVRESASTEVLDLLPPWFPPSEPIGHQVLRDQFPVFVRVADREVAVIARSPVSGLVVRGALAHGMGQLFDLLWERSRAPMREQVLRLMAAGLDDAAVAAATGRSVRTVRAHVAALMAELGAETRLAAGVEAVRKGWL